MNKDNIDILLITGGDFGNKSLAGNIDKLLSILLKVTCNIYLVTHCDKKLISSIDKQRVNSLRIQGNRFKSFLLSQILTSKAILSLYRRNNIETTMFAFGQDLQILPMIIAKMVSKRVIIRSDGRPTVVLRRYLKSGWSPKIYLFKLIEETNYRLADVVLTECQYMIAENNFQKYKSQEGGELFVDINKFVNTTCLRNRTYEIGFVGRLSQEKGILNFLKALESLNRNTSVVVVGDGKEKNNVLSRIQLLRSKNKLNIEHVGWIEDNRVPHYLNKIKLIVVPSYKEGLPNILLEAMACASVILATPVGGIPGLIKDEESGFIMEDNSPECIARNVIRVLNHPNLEEIARNACALIKKQYTYEAAIERYRKILMSLRLK